MRQDRPTVNILALFLDLYINTRKLTEKLFNLIKE